MMPKDTIEQSSVGSALTKDTLTIVALTIASNALAIFRESIFASRFGTDAVADAYIISFSACSSIFLLLSSGNVSFAFIPRVQQLTAKSEKNLYYTTILFLVGGLALAISTVFAMNAGPIVATIAPGSSGDTALFASKITASIAPIIFFSALGSVYQAALNSELKFLSPALVPALSNTIFISVLILLRDLSLERQIIIATLASYSMWMLLAMPTSKLYSSFQCKPLNKSIAYASQFTYAMMPLLLITAIDQAAVLIQKLSLSFVSLGAISAVNYANRLESIPVGLIATAFSTAIFPRLAYYFAKSDKNSLSGIFNYGLEAIILVSLPATTIFIALSRQIVEVLLMRGAFSETDVRRVAVSLAFYSAGIIPQVLTVYFSRLVLSASDYKNLLRIAFVTSLVFIPLVLILPRLIGEVGIPLATTINGCIYSLLLLREIRIYVEIPYAYFTGLLVKASMFSIGLVAVCIPILTALPALASIAVVATVVVTSYCLLIYKFIPLVYSKTSIDKMLAKLPFIGQ